jgi:hypothetical protein
MPSWFNYTPLAPLLPKYVDDGTRDLLTIDHLVKDLGKFKVSAIGTPAAVELVRVETVGSDGNLTEQQVQVVSQLADHMLSVLRFTTDQHVEKLWFGQETVSLGSHGDGDGKPNLGVSISLVPNEDYKLDCANIASVFEHTVALMPLFKLLADTQQPILPMPYRYLSAYKVLELEFRSGKKWPGLKSVLAPYEEEYRKLELSGRTFENLLHEMRDKCAHIKLGDDSDSFGITGLSGRDLSAVEKLFPLLKKILFAHLGGKYSSLKFT